MGNLAHDTALTGSAGVWHADLSADWAIWGPNGGYLAAIALRAAGAHSNQPLPASASCHFLGVARFGPVQVATETLRGGKKAESIRVTMSQDGAPILDAMVWTVADDLDGLQHDHGAAPRVPPPGELRDLTELLADDPGAEDQPPHKFFENFEERPVEWVPRAEWEQRTGGDPQFQSWYRFCPQPVFDDPFVDAGRLAILVDTFMWPAATRAYGFGELRHIAPSLDLHVSFHRPGATEWLLVDALSHAASNGLVGGKAQVWTESGQLVASGTQQMLCRPAPVG